MSEKTWGGEAFWGLGYEWDPDWLLTDRQRQGLRRRAQIPPPQPRAARRARLSRADRADGVRRPRRGPRRVRDDVRDDRALRLRVDGDVLRDAHGRGQRDHAACN